MGGKGEGRGRAGFRKLGGGWRLKLRAHQEPGGDWEQAATSFLRRAPVLALFLAGRSVQPAGRALVSGWCL